jgi:hypothetical protein
MPRCRARATASLTRADTRVAVEDQLGVEDVVADLGDLHLFEAAPERGQDVADQLVSDRAWARDAALFHRDRVRFGRADPHRQ